jgi:hypothetical protein
MVEHAPGVAGVHAGPAPRAELLHVLMLPDFERADRIGKFWSYHDSRTFAELLIDCEEDKAARASGCWPRWSGSSPDSSRARLGDHLSHSIEARYGHQLMHALRWAAYVPPMKQVDPLRSSRNDTTMTMVFCATCGHSQAAHSNSGDGRCLRSACDCDGFIVGQGPDLSAQVLPF